MGGSDARAAREADIRPRTVRTWRDRCIDGGLDALSGKGRPGRPGEVAGDEAGGGVRATLEKPPPDGGTHLADTDDTDDGRPVGRTAARGHGSTAGIRIPGRS
ncbi:helix-turn-helix domain-containing protein [Marinactinospora rubrisoli]|uniref:Helix-turn-helix domain-containing protein n=1 Tax=Marinactinospora rubrisoli TaxID=2715399 RepID=A0ABW2KJE3_9ACTN